MAVTGLWALTLSALLYCTSAAAVPGDHTISLQELEMMIAKLEERRKSLPARNSSGSSSSRSLRRLSDKAAVAPGEMRPTQKATCSFDIIGVVLAVARTGTVLYFVQDTCRVQDTVDQKTACAAVIIGLFSNLGFLISFMSDAIAQCQATLVAPALCAANVGNMIAVLSITGSTISSMQNSCRTITAREGKWRTYLPEAAVAYDAFKVKRREYKGRSLRADTATVGNHSAVLAGPPHASTLPAPPTQRYLEGNLVQEIRNKLSASEFRKVEISQCVFDVMLTGMFFGRGLLELYNTAMHSPCEYDEDFRNPTEADATCLVQVSNLITVFDFVGALIALTVSECPEGVSLKALCAADATITVGAITALIQTGTAFLLVCGETEAPKDVLAKDIASGIVI